MIYLEPVALALSQKSGRPVKMMMTREEVFRATGPTSGAVMRGQDRRQEGRHASSRRRRAEVPGRRLPRLAGRQPGCMCGFALYDIPNFVIDGYDVVVNRPKVAAYRAPGAPIASFAVESAIDELARKLEHGPDRAAR